MSVTEALSEKPWRPVSWEWGCGGQVGVSTVGSVVHSCHDVQKGIVKKRHP